jgi:HAD superfamily hydrolase (TIGR01509 family)
MARGLIFDLDGVIFDSHPVHRKAWRGLLQKAGRQLSDDELDFIMDGATREELLHHFFGPLNSQQIASYARLKETMFQNEERHLQMIGGLEGFLDLVEGACLPKVVATSASRSRARRILEQHKLTARFTAVITGDDVCKGKSDPAIFVRGAEELGLRAADVLVFEDAVPAIRSVKSIGMKCIGVASGNRSIQLLEAGADRVITDFRQLHLTDVMDLFQPA